MPRLFVGTFLADSDQAKLAKLKGANLYISKGWGRKVRFIDQEKLHLTWAFIGEVDHSKLELIAREVETAIGKLAEEVDGVGLVPRYQSLEIDYDRIELWPNSRRARLGVLAAAEAPDKVLQLGLILEGALDKYKPEAERNKRPRDFRPHITVFRVDQPRRNTPQGGRGGNRPSSMDEADIEIPPGTLPIKQRIDTVALIESCMNIQPPVYKVLRSFSLDALDS